MGRARLLTLAALMLGAVGLGGCGSSTSTTAAASGAVALNVTAPSSGSVVNADNVTVRGTVTPTDATVQVEGHPAPAGNGVFVGTAAVHGGANTIDVIASAPGYTPASTTVTVTGQTAQSSTPPATSKTPSSGAVSSTSSATPAALESATAPSGAYTILVPSNWSYRAGSSSSETTTDLWVGSNPLEKLQVIISSCASCATGPNGPDARSVGLPQGTVSSFDINQAALGFQAYRDGDPYSDNGVIVATSQGSTATGYAQVDLWLPDSDHATATRILDSFSLLQNASG
jgi:hypothetical protein